MPVKQHFQTIVVTLLIMILPNSVFALDLYGFGSYWEVEDTEGTWGGGVGVSLPLFTDYLKFDTRAYIFENTDIDDDDELELLPLDFGLQLHLMPEERFDCYILGGASYIYADADRIDVDSDFGAYIGGGLQFNFSDNLALFGEGVYRMTELDSDRGRFDEEIDVSGVTANVGLKVIL